MARLTLNLLGYELDVTLGLADAPSPAPDAEVLSGGTTAGFFIAPVAKPEMPDEIPGVDRNNGWGDEE